MHFDCTRCRCDRFHVIIEAKFSFRSNQNNGSRQSYDHTRCNEQGCIKRWGWLARNGVGQQNERPGIEGGVKQVACD